MTQKLNEFIILNYILNQKTIFPPFDIKDVSWITDEIGMPIDYSSDFQLVCCENIQKLAIPDYGVKGADLFSLFPNKKNDNGQHSNSSLLCL